MDIFGFQIDDVLATALVAGFALGVIADRLLTSRRERQVVKDLKDQVARFEQQGDAAHRAALDLAARHNQLVGEHHEAEWLIRNLKAKLERQGAELVDVSGDSEPQAAAMNEAFWTPGNDPAVERIN